MTRWEYTWLRVPLYGHGKGDDGPGQYDLDTLDAMGADGWEAYSITEQHGGASMVVHLKRVVPTGGTSDG